MTTTENLILAVLSATEERKELALKVLRGEAEVGMAKLSATLQEITKRVEVSSCTRREMPGAEQAKTAFVAKRTAAKYCALSQRTLDYARERGELPFYKVGSKVVFLIKDLDTFMKMYRIAV
jgi:excisionase family DNA binding protein